MRGSHRGESSELGFHGRLKAVIPEGALLPEVAAYLLDRLDVQDLGYA